MTKMLRYGVDLGGTKTEIVALDGEREVFRKRVPTPSDNYEAIVAGVGALFREACTELGAAGSLGVGTPGSVSPKTGSMRNSNTAVLNGRPLKEDLEAAVGQSIRLENDANCFALSEATHGAGADADVVFGVILGTGVGGGVVVHGRVLRGANGVAGEWGHSPQPAEQDGPACYCGQRGCVETYLSGPALAAEHAERTGAPLRSAESLAHRGEDPAVEATWQRYEERLGRALAGVVNLLDPDVIVLGGGISRLERLYENVPLELAKHVFSDVLRTRLVPAHFGDSSGVRGAACL